MKDVKVTKKQSDIILKRLKKADPKIKSKRIKTIGFHKDFDKGARIVLCLECGFPLMFWGAWDMPCDLCGSEKVKIYALKDLDKFIRRLQDISYKKYKV